jgi:ankyrin repeat protein
MHSLIFRVLRGFAVICCLVPAFAPSAHAGAYEDMIEAIKRDDFATVSGLIARGVAVDTVDGQGNSLLSIAAREGSLRSARALLDAHARIDWANKAGETALMHGAIQGHLEVVRLLLVRGAEVNRAGWSPLIYAAVKGSVPVARLLLAYGADIDAGAPNGFTALMMAVREGHQELAGFLVSNHASVNVQTDSGLTALAIARKSDNAAMLGLLQKAGAK